MKFSTFLKTQLAADIAAAFLGLSIGGFLLAVKKKIDERTKKP